MCYDELKLEITRTLSELKSVLEIIKILQEDNSTNWTGCGWQSGVESKINQSNNWTQNKENEGKWTVVESYRHRNSRKLVRRQPQWSFRNVNRYEVLQNTNEKLATSQNLDLVNNKEMVAKKRKRLQREKRTIVVVGDSYTRGMAGEISHNLGSSFEVIGYVKPGAGMKVITDMPNQECTTLTKEDMVVIWGGANDIAKNETNIGLTHITNFVKLRKHTNVLLMGVPTRFDLSPTSCVNSEVIAFNRKLYKRMKQFEHVKIIDSELQRKYFTKHGMHMNIVGKEIMVQRIAEKVRETFSKGTTSTIILRWKKDMDKGTVSTWKPDTEISRDETTENMQENLTSPRGKDNGNPKDNDDNSRDSIILNSVLDCSENRSLLPKRDRKGLKAKNEDFLWF
jgi:hypothetical protein